MSTQVQSVVVGPIQTNCYIVSDEKGCLVIDPGDEFDTIAAALAGRSPDLVVLTHRHWDHLQALPTLLEAYKPSLFIHELDADAALNPDENGAPSHYTKGRGFGAETASAPERRLKDGDSFEVGDMHFDVIHTPGHTIGSICLYDEADQLLFSGDTLFYGSYGRTDLPTGSDADMAASLKKLAQLPEGVCVYPGHGPMTNIGYERQNNPLMSRQ